MQLLAGLKVLVVDDSRVNRDLARGTLERNGAKAYECETAESALELALTMRPDAVLLDMHLPGMDGWGAARRLRVLTEAPIPVIVVSTARNDRGEQALADAGIVAWLPKPLQEAEMIRALLHWTGRELKAEMPMDNSPTQPHDLAAALAALKPEIREMLEEDLPQEMQQAEQAFASRDWTGLQSHVHRLHGTASFCRLENLRTVCAGIERGLKDQQPPTTNGMQALTVEIGRVMTSLSHATG